MAAYYKSERGLTSILIMLYRTLATIFSESIGTIVYSVKRTNFNKHTNDKLFLRARIK